MNAGIKSAPGRGGSRSAAAQSPDDAKAAQAFVSVLGIATMNPDDLEPPDWYPKDPKSLKVFRELGHKVARAMSLQPEHADMVAQTAFDQLEIARLRTQLAKDGYTYKTKTATGDAIFRERPEAKALQAAQRRVQINLIEFGMTPLAWARNIAKAVEQGLIEAPNKKGKGKEDGKFAKFRR